MTRNHLQANLDGLCQSLEDYAKANGIGVLKTSSTAAHLSDSPCLAHSTSDIQTPVAACYSRHHWNPPMADDGVASPFDSGGSIENMRAARSGRTAARVSVAPRISVSLWTCSFILPIQLHISVPGGISVARRIAHPGRAEVITDCVLSGHLRGSAPVTRATTISLSVTMRSVPSLGSGDASHETLHRVTWLNLDEANDGNVAIACGDSALFLSATAGRHGTIGRTLSVARRIDVPSLGSVGQSPEPRHLLSCERGRELSFP